MEISVEIVVAVRVSEEFKKVVESAHATKAVQLTYKGTDFRIDSDQDGDIRQVVALLSTLDTPLPKVFEGELRYRMVIVKANLPKTLLAKQGWYAGENFGFPNAGCSVLAPDRLHSDPPIYANGTDLKMVTGLFKQVMTGKLEPGYGSNPFSGKIYR